METLLQQANSLSNGQCFDVNFVSQDLQHKTKWKIKAFSQVKNITVHDNPSKYTFASILAPY